MVKNSGGFSLIEVVLAMGLVMFCALVILSLIPVGLNSLQDSSRQIVETEIFKSVGAELTSTPFAKLAAYQSERFPIFFNNEGSEVKLKEDSVFTAQCTAPKVESGGELSRMTVSIGYRYDPAQTNGGGKSSKRTFLLVNRGG